MLLLSMTMEYKNHIQPLYRIRVLSGMTTDFVGVLLAKFQSSNTIKSYVPYCRIGKA